MADRAVSFTFTTKDEQALAALKRMEKGFRNLDVEVNKTKTSGLNLGGALGGLAIGAGLSMAVNEFAEAEKVAAKTAAAIEATGGAAGKTADEVAKLSTELGNMAAVDNDVVQNAANVLLTFKQIQGANFDAALASTLDLSAAFGTDLQSAAMQVGKALNDPIKGLTALARAGVTFTAEQKDVIKSLVRTGDVAEAQRIILAELESQVGGAAEANATSLDRARVAVGNMAEQLGGALAPAVEVAAGALGNMAQTLDGLPDSVQTAALLAAGAAVAYDRWNDSLSQIGPSLTSNVSEVGKLGTAMAGVGAGLAAFTATTELLKELSDTDVNLGDLASELELLGRGRGGLSELLNTARVDIDSLASAFDKASDAPKDYADALQYLGSHLLDDPGGLELTQARNRVEEFDQAFASMVEGGNIEGAQTAFQQLSAALHDQGVSYEDIVALMPDYFNALDRAERAADDAASATDGMAGAVTDLGNVLRTESTIIGQRAAEMERLNEATEKSRTLAVEAASTEIAYMNAVDGTQQAHMALAEAKKKGDPAEIARAERDLAEAMLRQGEAAVANAQAQAEAEGRTFSNADANAVLRGELEQTRTTTGYWNDTLQTTVDRLAYVQAASDTATQQMIDDVQAVNEKLREQADLLKWNAALWRNATGEGGSLEGAPLGQGTVQNGGGSQTVPPTRDPDAYSGQRSLGVTIVAPNLTRLGSPSEVATAMDGAGRAMTRRLAGS